MTQPTLNQEKINLALLRQNIGTKEGDIESIVGTTADGIQYLMYQFSKLLSFINSDVTFDEVKKYSANVEPELLGFAEKCDSGQVLLTYDIKNKHVVTDVGDRSTHITKIITEAK